MPRTLGRGKTTATPYVYQPKMNIEKHAQPLRTERDSGVMRHAGAPVPQLGLAQVTV